MALYARFFKTRAGIKPYQMGARLDGDLMSKPIDKPNAVRCRRSPRDADLRYRIKALDYVTDRSSLAFDDLAPIVPTIENESLHLFLLLKIGRLVMAARQSGTAVKSTGWIRYWELTVGQISN